MLKIVGRNLRVETRMGKLRLQCSRRDGWRQEERVRRGQIHCLTSNLQAFSIFRTHTNTPTTLIIAHRCLFSYSSHKIDAAVSLRKIIIQVPSKNKFLHKSFLDSSRANHAPWYNLFCQVLTSKC